MSLDQTTISGFLAGENTKLTTAQKAVADGQAAAAAVVLEKAIISRGQQVADTANTAAGDAAARLAAAKAAAAALAGDNAAFIARMGTKVSSGLGNTAWQGVADGNVTVNGVTDTFSNLFTAVGTASDLVVQRTSKAATAHAEEQGALQAVADAAQNLSDHVKRVETWSASAKQLFLTASQLLTANQVEAAWWAWWQADQLATRIAADDASVLVKALQDALDAWPPKMLAAETADANLASAVTDSKKAIANRDAAIAKVLDTLKTTARTP